MNWKTIITAMLLPFWVIAGPSSQMHLPFRPITLQEAFTAASKEGKIVLVHFSASWCMPCQWMEKNTFTDPALGAYIQEHYVAVKIDFDDPQGQAETARYEVSKLPTILIFNSLRQLIGTHQEMMEPHRLLQILQRYSPKSSPVGGGLSAPKPVTGHLNRPPLVTNQTAENTSGHNPGIIEHRSSAPGVYLPNASNRKYGIQIAAFGEMENAQLAKTELEQRYRLPVVVIEDSAPGRASFFKVVVGAFKTPGDAQPLYERLQREGRQGYIREY